MLKFDLSSYNFFGLSKLKIFLITFLLLLIIIFMAVLFGLRYDDVSYTIALNGDTSVFVYKGTEYIDPGAKAYDDKNKDLSKKIIVSSNLNVNKNGRYEIIYKIGDISVKRVVRVIDAPYINEENYFINNNNEDSNESVVGNGETTLNLMGNDIVYLDVYGNYIEEGYVAIDTKDGNISKNVVVTHNIDNTKPGEYNIVYTVKNSSNIITTVNRRVIVMQIKMKLSIVNKEYTNDKVGIRVDITDDYFDYIILPDGTRAYSKEYIYYVSQNGDYKFYSYNKYGAVRELKITVPNIDKVAPTVSCNAEFKGGKTVITINASDNIGISSYVVNGTKYLTNVVSLDSLTISNNVKVYDMAGNSVTTTCNIMPTIYIEQVIKDGVIITVNSKTISSEVAGYYFSYTSSRPSKSSGGYISTDKTILDVVRLPGKTYVWVEDIYGNISEYKTVLISNDDLLITTNSSYKKLENISLESYLSEKGWSLDDFNKLIARSVRAAGLYSKDAAATAAVALQTVLAQKYQIKLSYWWGGKSWEYGANKSWGTYRETYSEEYDNWYYYYGMDCSGFTTWAYVNAGYIIVRGQYPSYWSSTKNMISFNENGGVPGDFIVSDGHVKLIVGKTSNAYICAEAQGKNQGMCVSLHPYSKKSGYYIVKGESIGEKYGKVSSNSYPLGF